MGLIEMLREADRQDGIQEGLETAVRNMLNNSGLSQKKIAEVLEVPINLVRKVKRRLNAR